MILLSQVVYYESEGDPPVTVTVNRHGDRVRGPDLLPGVVVGEPVPGDERRWHRSD